MKERESIIAFGLFLLLLISWFGFVFHRSPSFAGSFWGGVLGISGAALMLIPLLYSIIKRIGWIKVAVTRHISLRTLLTWHIYAGILGPILGLLHTGHKFESVVGITLTSLMLVVVFSGFIGRYLLSFISSEIKDKKALLAKLEQQYHQAALELQEHPEQNILIKSFTGIFPRMLTSLLAPAGGVSSHHLEGSVPLSLPTRVIGLSESIADVEYAIKTHDTFRAVFSRWLKLHILISFALYSVLAVHVFSGIYFGLRWFR